MRFTKAKCRVLYLSRGNPWFMQVKFGCARTQKYSKKRNQQPSLCPAYFVLQYKEDIDQLVISELDSNHVHADPVFSLTRATAATASTTACDGPATKLCKQQAGGTDSGAVLDEHSHMVTGQPVDGMSALYKAPALPEAVKENASASALVRIAEVMKTFLRVDRGSLASISADSNHGLDRLSFQTSKMKSLFMQFPKSLLLHRVLSEGGHVLYAFIVESKERVGKVVHLSLLKDDTGHSVRKMLTVFKEFNPEWQKVQAVFVGVSFFHKAILHELFPSAQVLLSVYHTVRLLEKNVKEAEISSSFKQNLMLALQKAVFATSAASLDALSQLIKHVVSPELYDYLRANWFSCELLWCMHTEKGLHSCGMHMDSLDLITHRISSLFGQQPSLEASVLCFMECADCLDSRGLESTNWGFLNTKDGQSSLWETPDACSGAAADPGPASGSPSLAEPTGQAAVAEMGCMLATLRDACTDLDSWLCLKEWEVVQTSTQLLSPMPGSLTVRLLEDVHQVSRDCRRCTCCFHRRYPFLSAAMGGVFTCFPRALLVHRAGGPAGRALYIFLVAGPALALQGGMARVVHRAIPRDQSLPVLAQAFPAAEVQLSVFHLCKRLQQQIQQLALEGRVERLILAALSNTTSAAPEGSCRKMHALLRDLMTPDLLPQLHVNWLLDDEIWAAHRERACRETTIYFRDLEMVTQGLSLVFTKLEATENPEGDSDDEINRRTEERIKQSLKDICTEPAARLCLSEFAVVQKSVQLIGTGEDALSIQVLEDAHSVDRKGLSSCTCHFNQVFQLPCRHILAVLNSDRKTLQLEMLSRQWQKGSDAHQAGQDSADGLLEVLKSSWNESLDKSLVVSFLTAEISRLLTHCSREEFERRYRTLRELADSWIGPYVEVKL
ncbi:PREDICTED: zinc finger SWIM domain-containing protein 3-like [Charadrius vociferus]|uniref:zinc finger SWIM domain-containing protein 3-like n=1 Tax=Charadrius vociferus TaxID=50402 RepID=UPI0005212D6D|nr:PREDICTED: zinc finger SWIM domain-containing protein 3-like [Charadrius vociferus]